MTIAGATNWAAHNVDPLEKPMGLQLSDSVFIGSHACSCGCWCCGPEDVMPKEYADTFPASYNCMTTIKGLFTAGCGVGACAHKFSSGSHVQGGIVGKSVVRFAKDNKGYTPTVSDATIAKCKETVFKPFALYEENKAFTTQPDVNPNYISPHNFLFRVFATDLLTAFADTPRLATAVFWAASRDEAMLVEHLVNVGRREAFVRAAHFLLELGSRLALVGMGSRDDYDCPLTQYHLADVLGLSAVHVNRVLRTLRERGLATFRDGRVTVHDYESMVGLAEFDTAYMDQDGPLLK